MIDSRVWIKQFQALPSHRVECVAFDHRGHGQSVCGDGRPSLENLAWDLRTVLDGLDLRDVLLVGHSMGGVAAQAFLTKFPDVARERVRGIVLLSSLAKTQLSTSQRLKAIAEQIAGGLNIGSAVSRPDFGTMVTRLGFGRDALASHVELNRQMLMECDPEIGREGVNLLLGLDLTADVASITIPTLVVSGSHDILTPPKEARRLAQLIPDAELVMFERAGHMIMLERADELNTLLLDFAREVGILPVAAGAAAL
jgi:pimeloyl-ACP methyl ester carboxylesterase